MIFILCVGPPLWVTRRRNSLSGTTIIVALVSRDYYQALIWYRKSAGQGYAPAQNQLGYMHQHKFGLPRDYKRALNYYRLAANKGYAPASTIWRPCTRVALGSSVMISKPSDGTAKQQTRICRR